MRTLTKRRGTCRPLERFRCGRASWCLHEPIVQFLLIGLVIWLVAVWLDPDQQRYSIDVDEAQAAQIAAGYARQFGQPPTPKQLHGLIVRYVADEIAYREGMAMALDKNDEIVRRRIVQKYTFLSSDQEVPRKPSDATLLRWFKAHQAQYRDPARTSFVHIYFSPDNHRGRNAQSRAQDLLANLPRNARPADYGDAFPGPAEANDLTQTEIGRVFGNSPISQALPNLAVGLWAGPYRSGYGWHLVRVSRHKPSVTPPLAQMRDQVLTDYLNFERARLDQAASANLRKRYTVRYLGRPL